MANDGSTKVESSRAAVLPAGREVKLQEKLNTSPSTSVLAEPSSVTVSPTFAACAGPAFATGAVAGLLLRADSPTRRALTFEVGIQNSGLAIVILLGQFDGLGGAAAIAAVWGIWHLIAGGTLVGVMRRYDV